MALKEECLFGCLWCRSRITTHRKFSKAEELLDDKLDLSQYIFAFLMDQSSSSNFALQAEINERPLRAEFAQSRFFRHCSREETNILQSALRKWRRKEHYSIMFY